MRAGARGPSADRGTMMIARVLVAVAVLALAAGAAGPAAPDADAAPALRSFASCDAFAAHMRAQARRVVTPYGLPVLPGASLPVGAPGLAAPEDAAAPVPSTGPGAPVEGRDFSGTNLQEGGVDEPDIVKTDGRRIYSLMDGTVRVVDVGGPAPRLVGRIDVRRLGARSLMLVSGRLLVLGQTGHGYGTVPMVGGDTPVASVAPGPATPPRVTVVELDVSDPSRMRVLGRVTAEGGLVAARRTGTGLRLVVSSAADPVDLPAPEAGTARAMRAARVAHRRALGRTAASDWLPRLTVRRRATGTTVRRVIAGCRSVARPRIYSGLGMVTVLTLATDRGLTVTDSDAVLTDGDVVYASPGSLYVATPRWVDPTRGTDGAAPRGTTLIHRFDTRSPSVTAYRGSAGVPGYALNQFSLSEHDGHLRVATTQEPEWWDAPAEGDTSQSYVTVLSTAGGRLRQTGRVGGLGRGERIYAVRFIGDRGYVVTFRQTDPLYSLDLSDPGAPRVTGELKINGYSAYLHPVDDGTLIGIGQDATDEGRILGTQVSLFDVADPANPARIAQRRLGSGYSEAEGNHLAVLYWPATGTLVIPLDAWGGPEGTEAPFTGAVALAVSRRDGVRDIGRIAHGTGAPVRRAVVVGGDLYTLSALGLKRNALADLSERGFVPFT